MAKGKDGKPLSFKEAHGYHFFGPPGVSLITIVLPIICYAAYFLCNDVSGCPAPSLLHPSTLTLERLKKEVGWHGPSTLLNTESFLATIGYYFLSLVLYATLPAQTLQGTELQYGSFGRLTYRFNAFYSALFTMAIAAAGTFLDGANWVPWVFIWKNQIPLLTSNMIISYALATFVYVRSFSIKPANPNQREHAPGGISGNIVYDWFIGREMNPRVTLPLFGEVDIKTWMELRPGMLLWVILGLASIARQYRTHGTITASILLVVFAQSWYVFDALYMEPAILTTIDIITDGFGFMLSFGDLVWVPFIYVLPARYLAVHPVQLGVTGTALVMAVQATGYYIFRATNNEKNRFRNNPKDPKIAHLEYMETKSGSKLLTSGWWGTARHINYLGDWFMSWAYCLPTLISGYVIQQRPASPDFDGTSPADGGIFGGQPVRAEVVPGEAKGWGIIVTYFFMLYFAILLLHRERRDEQKCRNKYGADWDIYCKKVPWRIVPGVY